MDSGGITDKLVLELEFDVAVTTQEDSKTKGGIGIFVGSIGIGAQGQSGTSLSEINRIKFKVPLALPEQS